MGEFHRRSQRNLPGASHNGNWEGSERVKKMGTKRKLLPWGVLGKGMGEIKKKADWGGGTGRGASNSEAKPKFLP